MAYPNARSMILSAPVKVAVQPSSQKRPLYCLEIQVPMKHLPSCPVPLEALVLPSDISYLQYNQLLHPSHLLNNMNFC
jgi:hypothetical protein